MNAYATTDIGKMRRMNQDSVFASTQPVGSLPNLFLVADGMGGQKAGDFASRFAVENLVDYLRQSGLREEVELLRRGIEDVNRQLYETALSDSNLEGTGTTLVACTIVDSTMYVANVGDSRLYLIRKDGIRQITRDHSYVEEMVSLGRMDRGSDTYRKKKNIITRAVGADKNIEADFFEINLKEGDHILLCSDGLTNMVDNASIYRIASVPGTLELRAQSLISLANQNGGKDNIAVVMVEPQASEVNLC